ncbi:HTH CenpB-type DNA-binding domain [Fusarium oxysporum f. sp. vasinfectum]|nr:HTH CenpB-type DNA-binding domain [Fusarium oxysporum f. sp. vasinfectum]
MNTSFESPEPTLTAVQRWINSVTGKPNISRFTSYNLEQRTVAAVELFMEGFYTSIAKASREWRVPYKRLWSRHRGSHPVTQNGGNYTLFSKEEEQAILTWCWRRVTQGHHIPQRTLRQYANSVLKATDRDATASRYWARRFLRRYSQFFHKRKSQTLSAQRKAMSDRGNIQEWFRKWNIFTENEENDVDFENVWNGDETGFQIGYLKNGIFLWTFGEVEEPVLTDAHETISVTIVESISAKGQVIPPFIIMPGVQIPSRWVNNGLEGEATIATTPKGYIDDVTAQDYFDHFEQHTRDSPQSY